MFDEKHLRKFLEENGVKAEIIYVGEAATSREASRSAGVRIDKIAKTVIFTSDKGDVIAVVLRADRRVHQKRLSRLLGYKKLRLATKEEIIGATGYPPGAVPPIAHRRKIPVYVDRELLELDRVYAGGGSTGHLLAISPLDIVNLSGAVIIDVPKK